ncbi:Galanin-like G-protein coupled receptor npr-9 [Mactra antiquata]
MAESNPNLPNCSYPNCTNDTLYWSQMNNSMMSDDEGFYGFERYIRIAIPIIFGLFVALGLVGNLLVIVVILINQQMRSTTNLLILNLAFADLCFIVFCVPFTATAYAIPQWQFGEAWCKIHQYLIYVCAYASVYTLVIMSLDRYLAVVHPIQSMSVRNQQNTMKILIVMWTVILIVHIPLLLDYTVHRYPYYDEWRSACMLRHSAEDNFRRSFYKFLCCGNGQYVKVEYERTNVRVEKNTGTSRGNSNASKTTSTTTLQTYCNNSENGVEPQNTFTQTEV